MAVNETTVKTWVHNKLHISPQLQKLKINIVCANEKVNQASSSSHRSMYGFEIPNASKGFESLHGT